MSRIVRPTAYGGPDVLEVFDVPAVPPPPGHVAVRVRAAGVNPVDWKLYSGSFHAIADEHKADVGMADTALPAIGLECAGVVEAVGAAVHEIAVGDEVLVFPVKNAYADRVVVPESALVLKPASLEWAQAGGLLLAGVTASHALHAAEVAAAETVLIHGGSGGVGLIAIQLAVALGAQVIATAAEPNHTLLRRLGATPVSYGPGLLDRVQDAAPDGVQAALDLVGTDEALDTSLALVDHPARIASIAGGPRRAQQGAKILGNAPGADMGTTVRMAARQELASRAGDGSLEVIVAATYPLERAADAHRAGQAGHSPGKLVLVP